MQFSASLRAQNSESNKLCSTHVPRHQSPHSRGPTQNFKHRGVCEDARQRCMALQSLLGFQGIIFNTFTIIQPMLILAYVFVGLKGLTEKTFYVAGSESAERVSRILLKTKLLNDVKKLSPLHQTSSIESFHALILRFAPKTFAFSYLGMHCR